MKVRKKPVVVEAHLWHKNGDHPEDYLHDREGFDGEDFRVWPASYAKEHDWEGEVVRRYRTPDDYGDRPCGHCNREMNDHGWIDTLEGGHIVCPGDWIITGVMGEYYPCKPEIFEETYEILQEEDDV